MTLVLLHTRRLIELVGPEGRGTGMSSKVMAACGHAQAEDMQGSRASGRFAYEVGTMRHRPGAAELSHDITLLSSRR